MGERSELLNDIILLSEPSKRVWLFLSVDFIFLKTLTKQKKYDYNTK